MDIAAEVEITTTTKKICGSAKKRAKGSQGEAKRRKTLSNKENAEVEPKKKSKCTRPTLIQKSQRTIVQAIQQVAASDLVASVLGEVDDQLHIATFSNISAFWEKLKVSDLLPNLCTSLKDTYVTAYTSCGKGKDKYMSFQLEWYRRCSFMLQDSTPDTTTGTPDFGSWWSFRNDFLKQIPEHDSLFHCNAVMIAVQSAVYNYLSSKATAAAPIIDNETLDSSGDKGDEVMVEPDDVYYRFGGAAIAEMLHNCYKSIHTCPMEKRSGVVSEITVIKAMQCVDKSVVPASLQYRDRGFMYFPKQEFIPFIRAVDQCVLQVANKYEMQKVGKHLIEVATERVKNNSELRETYTETLLTIFDSIEGMTNTVDKVYSELTRKLCNTRLAEFVDSFKQIEASKVGSATLSGLNLRDTLLHDHVNLKTQFN